jgi:hypothetical protein
MYSRDNAEQSLPWPNEAIKKMLSEDCRMLMNRFQIDSTYREEELGNELYSFNNKVTLYSEGRECVYA